MIKFKKYIYRAVGNRPLSERRDFFANIDNWRMRYITTMGVYMLKFCPRCVHYKDIFILEGYDVILRVKSGVGDIKKAYHWVDSDLSLEGS